MLRKAMVRGIPARSKLANWSVYMANSFRPGFLGPRAKSRLNPVWELSAAAARAAGEPVDDEDFAGLAEPFAGTTETGITPNRSTCTTAAARSPASRTPSTTSPERRRAL